MSIRMDKKKNVIHTMEYCLAIKNEILSFVAIWTDLEIIILSEISQRKTNIIYHLHMQSKIGHK